MKKKSNEEATVEPLTREYELELHKQNSIREKEKMVAAHSKKESELNDLKEKYDLLKEKFEEQEEADGLLAIENTDLKNRIERVLNALSELVEEVDRGVELEEHNHILENARQVILRETT